jgi:hypothetical protein
LFRRFQGLETTDCPFGNLPEPRGGRWGQGLTAEKMQACRWLRPVLVGQFEFLEWTPDKDQREVITVEVAMKRLEESAQAAFAAEEKLIDILNREGFLQ